MTSFLTKTLSNAPLTTASFASVINGSDIYIFGGVCPLAIQTPNGVSPYLFRYNTSTNSWDLLPSNSTALAFCSAVFIGQTILVFGGSTTGNVNTGFTNSLWAYNISTQSWSSLATGPAARTAHSAVAIGSDMFVFGGFPNGSDLWRYRSSNNSWTQMASHSIQFAFHSAVVIFSDMFIFGGNTNQASSDLWRYSSANNSWTLMGYAPIARINHAAVAVGSDMFIFGGYDAAGHSYNDLSQYNSGTNSWTQAVLSTPPAQRVAHTALNQGQNIFIFGGFGSSSILNDLWELLPSTISISNIQIPATVLAGSTFNVSFAVGEQNGVSDRSQVTLNLGSSNSTMSVPNNSTTQTTSVQAPATGGNYPLTITAYDPLFTSLSDVETVSVPVLQLIKSDWLSTNTISFGDSYTIFWSDQVLPANSNLVISINRPEGLSGNYSSSGQLQSVAPLAASDYIITITRTVGSCVTSDTLILHVKMLSVNAGSDQVIQYGQSAQLSVSATYSPATYSWSPSSTLVGANTSTPTATPLTTTTYTVVAYASDIRKYASDSVTVSVLAPISLNASISPTVTAPAKPVVLNWSIISDGSLPPPPLSYRLIIQRSDGSYLINSDGLTSWSSFIADTSPQFAGYYPYTVTVIRDNFGNLSDRRIVPLNVTQVTLSNVQVLSNPIIVNDSYSIQWIFNIANPQTSDAVAINIYGPNTSAISAGNYTNGQVGSYQMTAPSTASDYLVTVTASDSFGSFYSTTCTLQTINVTTVSDQNQSGLMGDNVNFLTTFLSNSAIPRADHSAVTIGSDMYIFGGDNQITFLSDLWKYNRASNSWRSLKNCPITLNSHSAVVFGKNMFIFGGSSNGSIVNNLWLYNSVSDSWSQLTNTNAATARVGHSAVAIGSDMFIFGGFTQSPHGVLSDLWSYNNVTGIWNKIIASGPPSARSNHSAVVIGLNMYVFGGSGLVNETDTLNDLWVYSSGNNSWSQLANGSTPRLMHSAVAIGSDMFIFDGIDPNGNPLSDVWCYNSVSNSWIQLPPLSNNCPAARSGHTTVVIGSNVFLFGGTDNTNYFSDLWKFLAVPVTISINNLQTPAAVFGGSNFNVSFLVSGQNCNGPAKELIGFGGSNQQITAPITGGKIFWGSTNKNGGNGGIFYLYSADYNPNLSSVPYNIKRMSLQGGPTGTFMYSISVDIKQNIVYACFDGYNNLFFGYISDTIILQTINQSIQLTNPSIGGVFFGESSEYIYLGTVNGNNDGIYVFEISNNLLVPVNQNLLVSISIDNLNQGIFVDSTNNCTYYVDYDYNQNYHLKTTANAQDLLFYGNGGNSLTGVTVDVISSTIYWTICTDSGQSQLWMGTLDSLTNPTSISNQTQVGGFYVNGNEISAGLCLVVYPLSQTTMLQAPTTAGNYPLTITAYASDFPSVSDTVTVQVPVMQLVISDSVSPVPVATGGNYTTSWTVSLINQPSDFTTDPIVVNVNRPGGLSSNHKETGQVQDLAPSAASDYPITITANINNYYVSDVFNLQVKQLKVSAGVPQTVQYGHSVQLGSPQNPPGINYIWIATSDLLNTLSGGQSTITALFTSTYTLAAYEPDINRYDSDSVTIAVVAPINFSDVYINPAQTSTSGSNIVQIGWRIVTPLPSPNYRITVARSTGTIIWNQFYNGIFSDVISDVAPTTTGVYPYYLTVTLTDYGQTSDSVTVNLTVIQPRITVAAIPNPTSINDPYLIQWTATAQNALPSDTFTVNIKAPGSDITFDCINGIIYSDIFNAPAIISDFMITATASYDRLSGCSASTSTKLKTVLVAVDAGPNQTINYGGSVQIGAGIHDPDITYIWNPSDGLNFSTELHPLASPLETTTYTVTAFRADVNKNASDSVTLYVVAPINLTGAVSPSASAPNTPITISWNITNEGPAPSLSYYLLIQRSDGSSVIDSDGYTAWSGSVIDTAPAIPGYYPYTITIIRDDFGNTSDQITLPFNVTQVKLTNVQAITNPTPTADPYLIEWTVNFQNPQPNGVAVVTVYAPEDLYVITSDVFSANYLHGQTGSVPAIAPNQESDYQITVTASDNFGNFHSTTIDLRTRFVTVDAGPDQTIMYGASTSLGLGFQESDITYLWTPVDTLDNPNVLNPTATPLTSTAYTVVAFRDFTLGVTKYASDSTTIIVVAPITLFNIGLSPLVICATSGDSMTINWSILQSDPYPNYIAMVQHPDGSLVWSSDCSGLLNGSVTLTPPTTPGSYPYILSVTRTDYGQLSDQITVNLDVVQLSLSASPVANPVSISDLYEIQCTATALGGASDDTITVTIYPPDVSSFTSDCTSGTTCTAQFWAPNAIENNLPVTVTAVYDAFPSCTTSTTFTFNTVAVAVDAGPNQTITYGSSTRLGKLGTESPDISYTWSPDYEISSTNGLYPTVSPLETTTYQVIAYRTDINQYAVDSVTITVVSPITISDIQITPNPTVPGMPINITWTLVNQIPSPVLNYDIYIQRSDGSIVAIFDNYTELSGIASDTAPEATGTYPYTITVIRSDFGQLSDQQTISLNTTQVYLSNVEAVTNPIPTGDPYLIQWTVNADNPQPHEIIRVNVITPNDNFGITPETFTALYAVGETGEMIATAPNSDGFYPITVTAYDDFGSSDSAIINLQTRFVTVDAGSDRTINYGDSTTLGLGLQESDITYSWTPAYGLSATNILNPVATPLIDTIYTVTATRDFGSGVTKSSMDTIAVTVVSSIEFVDLTLTPSLVSIGQPVQIGWQIITPDPIPHYHLTITRSDGSVVISSDYQWGFFSDVATDISPSIFGVYPYYVSAVRYDYGGSSDHSFTNLSVVEANIVANALPNPTNDSDPFYVQWTASVLGGAPSDTLTVTINVPNNPPLISDCTNNRPYQAIFQAPTLSSDYVVTALASYDLVPACSDIYSFVLQTKRVVVDAGSDRVIDYGSSTMLGVGIADPDVAYTWTPSSSLNTSRGLNPIATPLTTTAYTVVAFRSDLNRYASDSVIVSVVAPIQVDVGWV